MTESNDYRAQSGQDVDAFGDTFSDGLPLDGRKALVTLLTSRFISKTRHAETWDALINYEAGIRDRLSDMFLDLEIDMDYEVAFKRQNGEEDVPILLRKEKPLPRDASFLLIFLRREHAYTDARDETITVSRTHISEFLSRFYGDSSQDEVKWDRQVSAAITAVTALKLLAPETDDPELYAVSPAIVPLITNTELAHFEQVYFHSAGVESEDEAAAS